METLTETDISNNCKCGWGGDNCDVPLVDKPLDYTCSVKNGFCSLVETEESTTAECVCYCSTWGGPQCTDYQVIEASAAISILMCILTIIILITWMSLRDKSDFRSKAFKYGYQQVTEWDRVPGIASYHPNSKFPQHIIPILCYRLVAFMFTLAILIAEITNHGFKEFQYFTVWNFLMLIVYFGIGVLVSYRGIMDERREEKYFNELKNAPDDNRRRFLNNREVNHGKYIPVKQRSMDLLQKAHFALLQLELPCALLIDVILWSALFPVAGNQFLNFYSYIQVSCLRSLRFG